MEIVAGVHKISVPNDTAMGLSAPHVYLVVAHEAAFINSGYGHTDSIQARLDYLQTLGNPKVTAIVITQRHSEHYGGAEAIHKTTGATIISHPLEKEAIEKGLGRTSVGKTVANGDTLDLGGATLEFIHTPGHTPGSLSILLREQNILFTGDTILGNGTTVVMPDGGDMTLYMDSLARLLKYRAKILCPGHGPVIRTPQTRIQNVLDKRLEREQQILALLQESPRTIEEFLKEMYSDLETNRQKLAIGQIRSHLIKLERENRVKTLDGGGSHRSFYTAYRKKS